MKKISIITISDGNSKFLRRTFNSIDSQNYKNFKNIVVSKKIEKNILINYKNKKRFFIVRKESSIYEAMNLGARHAFKDFVIYLNSGDIFYNSNSLELISRYLNYNSCLMFVTALKNGNDLFIPKIKIFFKNNFLSHSSFIRPPVSKKNNILFNEKKLKTADGNWMSANVNKFNIRKYYKPLTVFYLGGISNLPTKKTIIIKAKIGCLAFFKEVVKYFLLTIFGIKFFYRIIYFRKYLKLKYYEFNKIFK